MADKEAGDLEDHGVPADLLELYEVLEYTGKIVPFQSGPQLRTLSGDARIVTRAQWQARPPKGRTGLSDPQGNTAHWEGPKMGPFPHTSCATKVRGIQAFHMDSRGWVDIAYSSIVCPHGYIFVGRWWNTRTAANGTDAGNNASYAHCYLGGEGDGFTDDGKRAFVDVFSMAVATGAGTKRWSHSDWKATACPGDLIRNWVKAGMPVSSEPTPTPTPPPIVLEDSVPLNIHTVAIPTSPAGQPNAGAGWVTFNAPKNKIVGFVPPGVRPGADGYYETCEVGIAEEGSTSIVSVTGWAPGHTAYVQITVAG